MATGKLLCTLPPGPSKTGYVSSLHSGNSLPKATSAWDPKPVAVLACFSAAVTNTDQEQPGGEKAYLAYRGQSVLEESPCRNSGQEPKYKPEKNAASWLARYGFFSLLFYTTQGLRLRAGAAQ